VFEEADGSSRVIIPNWKVALTQERPELVRDGYVTIARAKLAKGDQIVDGLRELMVEDAFKPYRGDTALQLLRDFPNADHFRLDEIFDAVFATPAAHGEFLTLAERVLTGAAPVGEQQHDMWLAAAYLLSPSRYEVQVDAIAKQRPSIVFNLRDRSGYEAYGDQQPSALTVPQLEFLATLTGTHYPETGYPSGGWGGNTNPWDAAEYCRNLINAISAVPSEAATGAIRRLEADAKMASYNAHLRHALANQEKRRRESEYDRPDWLSTIEALSNGAPATVADLHALLLDQLDDLRRRISRENTDIYKSFWNLDSYSRPKTPRPEDACRDTLVTLLRPTLAPKGITVEPEGHMVADSAPTSRPRCRGGRFCASGSATPTPISGPPPTNSLSGFTRMILKPKGSASMACSGSATRDRHPCPNTRMDSNRRSQRRSWSRCCGTAFRRSAQASRCPGD
jgi:hypothetical protein